MGRRTALWKSALWGAIGGTLPDLDAFIDHGNAILNMTRHRAESHSLLVLTLLAPVMAWLVSRVHREPALFKRWWLALWLVLITHPLLDSMTVYGTQLLQPLSDHPFVVGSVFIIDPVYTLLLLVGVIATLSLKSARGLAWNAAGLVLSTLYLAWSFGAQQYVTQMARESLEQQGIETVGLLVTPAPFNTVLWRLVAMTPTHYREGYYSLLDDDPHIEWTLHDRGEALMSQHGRYPYLARIAAFSHGFYSVSSDNEHLFVTDLRMGQEPNYTFRFNLGSDAARAHGGYKPTLAGSRPDLERALPWLWHRLLGERVPPMSLMSDPARSP